LGGRLFYLKRRIRFIICLQKGKLSCILRQPSWTSFSYVNPYVILVTESSFQIRIIF